MSMPGAITSRSYVRRVPSASVTDFAAASTAVAAERAIVMPSAATRSYVNCCPDSSRKPPSNALTMAALSSPESRTTGDATPGLAGWHPVQDAAPAGGSADASAAAAAITTNPISKDFARDLRLLRRSATLTSRPPFELHRLSFGVFRQRGTTHDRRVAPPGVTRRRA